MMNMVLSNYKRRLATLLVVATAICVVGFFWWQGYRVNLSRSLPLGIYRLEHRQPQNGELVAFCIPERLAHMEVFSHLTISPCYGGSPAGAFGVPLLKRVTDISGDGGALIVRGDTARSVDSELFGPIMVDEIIGAVSVVYEF